MRVEQENSQHIVLTLTPWGPWIAGVIGGSGFLAFAVFDPAGMPGWANAVFAMLGIAAIFGFLASHAAIRAEFSRPAGTVTIRRKRPIGGTSTDVIRLSQIAAVEEVVETDADNTSFHRIELILSKSGLTGGKRVSLTSGPISTDMAETTRRLARWLAVPVGEAAKPQSLMPRRI